MASNSLDMDEVLSKNDIVDVISEYIPLKKKGANYVGLCPFHSDRNPSLIVNDTKQIFKCFSCGVGGNVIKFVSLAEKMDFRDALYFLADKAGIQYQKGYSSDYEAKNKLKQDILSLNKQTARFFHDSLNKSQSAIDYVNNRCISPEMVRKFGLGYAPAGWEALVKHFSAQGVSCELLLKAGLISRSSQNGSVRYYDRFVDRLMFPIFDDLGNVIGFGGRIMEKNDKMAKYINSAETPVYHKGNNLYGLNFAKKSNSSRAIIVEGYMDCIALHQKGINFAVASLGTALTAQQAKLLKKYFTEAIVAFDADEAGSNATVRGMDILKDAGLKVKVFRLQGAKDADEYLRKHTASDFSAQLDNAVPLTEYKVSLIAAQFPPDSNENKVSFIKNVSSVLGKGAVERGVYAEWLVKNYGEAYGLKKSMFITNNITEKSDDVRQASELTKPRRFILANPEQKQELSKAQKTLDFFEKSLLIILSEDAVCFKKLESMLKSDIMTFESNKNMFLKLAESYNSGKSPGSNFLMQGNTEDSVYAEILLDFILPSDTVSACREILAKLSKQRRETRKQEINDELSNPNIDSNKRRTLLEELKLLSGKKK